MPKIKLSIPSFNELASVMEQAGFKITEPHKLEIERSDLLLRPIDWRMATVRKDCLTQAVLSNQKKNGDVLKIADEMLQYVLNGKIEKQEKE